MLSTATGESKTVWQHSGTSGDAWFETAVSIGAQNMFQVIFSATVRNNAGDIAIDDISFIDCSPGNFYGPVDCSFESDFCNYLNQQHEVHQTSRNFIQNFKIEIQLVMIYPYYKTSRKSTINVFSH